MICHPVPRLVVGHCWFYHVLSPMLMMATVVATLPHSEYGQLEAIIPVGVVEKKHLENTNQLWLVPILPYHPVSSFTIIHIPPIVG